MSLEFNIRDLVKRLSKCNLCPRNCGVNRFTGDLGYCNLDATPLVSSITVHKGEEPVISGQKGICNVFFAHCNLSCVYCQNYQISRNYSYDDQWINDYEVILKKIIKILDRGISIIGFVSPSHQVIQMLEIINRLNQRGYNPVVLYNTNSYDNPDVLREIESVVDVYLADIKYFSNQIAKKYSDVFNYFDVAIEALKEMVWQKGTTLVLDDEGIVESGVIVRHLVLPGNAYDSKEIFNHIASEISIDITVSIMRQYNSTEKNLLNFKNLNRRITSAEYSEVVSNLYNLGFYKGWLQDFDSEGQFFPDFSKKEPFS